MFPHVWHMRHASVLSIHSFPAWVSLQVSFKAKCYGILEITEAVLEHVHFLMSGT